MDEHRQNDALIIAELRSMKEFLLLEISHSKEQIEILKKSVEENGKRIHVMELWQSNSIGKFSVIMIIVGIGVTTLTAWLTGHFK